MRMQLCVLDLSNFNHVQSMLYLCLGILSFCSLPVCLHECKITVVWGGKNNTYHKWWGCTHLLPVICMQCSYVNVIVLLVISWITGQTADRYFGVWCLASSWSLGFCLCVCPRLHRKEFSRQSDHRYQTSVHQSEQSWPYRIEIPEYRLFEML